MKEKPCTQQTIEELLESSKQVMSDVDKNIMKCDYNTARKMLSEQIQKIEAVQEEI